MGLIFELRNFRRNVYSLSVISNRTAWSKLYVRWPYFYQIYQYSYVHVSLINSCVFISPNCQHCREICCLDKWIIYIRHTQKIDNNFIKLG